MLVEASLERLPSNESSPFTRRGERGWGRVGETNQLAQLQNAINKIAAQAINTTARGIFRCLNLIF
jgi:hypothetical protein